MQAMQTCGASKQRHLASPRLTVKFFTRRPLGKELSILSRRVVIRSAYCSNLCVNGFAWVQMSTAPWSAQYRYLRRAARLASRAAIILLNYNISAWAQYDSPRSSQARYVTFNVRNLGMSLLAEHALRQSRDADHRPFTVGPPAIRSSAIRLR
jgi:hypothetical protein